MTSCPLYAHVRSYITGTYTHVLCILYVMFSFSDAISLNPLWPSAQVSCTSPAHVDDREYSVARRIVTKSSSSAMQYTYYYINTIILYTSPMGITNSCLYGSSLLLCSVACIRLGRIRWSREEWRKGGKYFLFGNKEYYDLVDVQVVTDSLDPQKGRKRVMYDIIVESTQVTVYRVIHQIRSLPLFSLYHNALIQILIFGPIKKNICLIILIFYNLLSTKWEIFIFSVNNLLDDFFFFFLVILMYLNLNSNE